MVKMVSPEIKYCECGCGQIVRNRFINGHANKGKSTWSKGIHLSEAHRRKIGEANRNPSTNIREKMSLARRDIQFSDKTKEKMSNAKKGKLSNSFGKARSGKTKEMMSKVHKQLWQNPEYRKLLSKQISNGIKELWADKMYKEKQLHAIGIGMNIRPNKPEQFLLDFLNKLYPNEWKYTGDFSFIINGKNPDFVNINGQKKIIELFGDYWHRGENPQNRINTFKPFGYDTLVIWERELKDEVTLKFKMNKFIRR